MIPNYDQCAEAVAVACPTLFDDCEAVLEVALGAVRDAFGEGPCGESVTGYVSLEPLALDDGNFVVVTPGPITPAPTKGPHQMALSRARVQATIVGVFSNYPTVTVTNNEAQLPPPGEMHAAARYVMSLGWCTWCAVVGAINGRTLLPDDDGTVRAHLGELTFSDFDGGQAGFELTLNWLI